MLASAVAAAITSNKPTTSQINSDNNGRVLVNSGVGGMQFPAIYSCVAAIGTPDCHLTEYSGTGIDTYLITSDENIYQTIGNTSLSSPGWAGDTTSQLQRIF